MQGMTSNPGHGHAKADRRNLHLHRVAIQKLRRQPELRKPALKLVEKWLLDEAAQCSRKWLEEWRVMLSEWTLDRLEGAVLDEEYGQTLRQCSPLGPILTPQERWKALREINERMRSERKSTPI